MIAVLCPHCNWRYRTRTEGMGRRVACKHCNEQFTVGEARPPHSWGQSDLGLDSWIGVEPPDEDADASLIQPCIICEAPMRTGSMICNECGANQLTGVKQRRRRQPTPEPRVGLGSFLPVRAILILLVLAAIGAGGYYAIITIAHSLVQTGEDVAISNNVANIRRDIRNGFDEYAIAERHRDTVTNANLAQYSRRFLGESEGVRQAASMLLACGNITNVQPMLDLESDDPANREKLVAGWEAIGPQRLIQLSCHEEDALRQAAAEGLARLAGADAATPEVVEQLAEKTTFDEKLDRYNELFRTYPEAIGIFVVDIEGERSTFMIRVDQYGDVFYFKIGKRVFRTPRGQRQLNLPLNRWCEATGQAVDPKAVSEIATGQVMIESPNGIAWRGEVKLELHFPVRDGLPGFLPIALPEAGETVTAPIIFIRP